MRRDGKQLSRLQKQAKLRRVFNNSKHPHKDKPSKKELKQLKNSIKRNVKVTDVPED